MELHCSNGEGALIKSEDFEEEENEK